MRTARGIAFFWLAGGEVTGWCSRNLALSLKLSSFWLKALVPAELRDTVMGATWEGIGTLPEDCTTLDCPFPVFPFPSLPWLASVCSCPMELRELRGQGGWMKRIPSKQQGTQKRLVLWTLQEFCSVSVQSTGRRWLWPPSAKMGQSSSPVRRIDTELEILLSFKSGMWVLYYLGLINFYREK